LLDRLAAVNLVEGDHARAGVQHRLASEALLFALVAAFGLIGAVVLGSWLAATVRRPLRRLQEAAHRVGVGQQTYRIPVEATIELAEVTAAFNAMADQLSASHEQLAYKAFHDPLT